MKRKSEEGRKGGRDGGSKEGSSCLISFVSLPNRTPTRRLNTIIDSDIVLVLEAGRVLEMGHPHELLNTPAGEWAEREGGREGGKGEGGEDDARLRVREHSRRDLRSSSCSAVPAHPILSPTHSLPAPASPLPRHCHTGLPASKGGFLSLVMETGPDTAASLKEMARVAWEAKRKKDEEQSLQNVEGRER